MGAIRIYDYKALKLQYVRGEMSLRALCELNNVKSASAVIKIAREENWDAAREEYRSRSTEKTLELLADREARRNLRVAEVEDNAIDLVDEAVNQVRGRIKHLRPVVVGQDASGEDIVEYDPELKISPKDLGNLLKGLAEVRGTARGGRQGGPDDGSTTITVPPGSDFALMSRFVKDVRARGGPSDEPFGERGLPSGPEGSG